MRQSPFFVSGHYAHCPQSPSFICLTSQINTKRSCMQLAGWNASVASANRVDVGGVPCSISSVTATTLTCKTGSMLGLVMAEYWNLPSNSWGVFPDVMSFSGPGASYCCLTTKLRQHACPSLNCVPLYSFFQYHHGGHGEIIPQCPGIAERNSFQCCKCAAWLLLPLNARTWV
jgi:hypothetical protein